MNTAANFQSDSMKAAMMPKAELATLSSLSQETKNRMAVDLTLLDAIEQGINTTGQLCSFMMTETFDNSVANYLQLIG